VNNTDKLLSKYQKKPSGVTIHIKDIEQEIDASYKKWGKFDGLAMGIDRLDQIVGGMRAGEVLLVGGDPNNGKSALAANVAVNVSKQHKVLFLTLEMLAPAIGTRMRYINNGSVDGMDMTFQSKKSINFTDLEPIFKEAVTVQGAKFVVIDYLQYLGRGMTNEEVAKMSQKIKNLAQEHEIPVMVVVSLRKDSKGGGVRRKWTEIEMDDLMGAGAIAYDADVIMVVSRRDADMKFDNEKVYVRVIKIRSFPLDYDNNIAELKWDRTKITDFRTQDFSTGITDAPIANDDSLLKLFPK